MIYEIKKYIKQFFFLIQSRKRQSYILAKNASLFWGLNNLAKSYNDNGDVIASMDISSESMKYLGEFIIYCEAAKINPQKELKLYSS